MSQFVYQDTPLHPSVRSAKDQVGLHLQKHVIIYDITINLSDYFLCIKMSTSRYAELAAYSEN